jgi:hypothetical protein
MTKHLRVADYSLMECDTIQFGRQVLMFAGNCCLHSEYKMEAADLSVLLVPNSLHVVTWKKIVILLYIVIRTSNTT